MQRSPCAVPEPVACCWPWLRTPLSSSRICEGPAPVVHRGAGDSPATNSDESKRWRRRGRRERPESCAPPETGLTLYDLVDVEVFDRGRAISEARLRADSHHLLAPSLSLFT